ncbi:MAG: cytochrome c oxidase assembly protein [Caldimonas sp.]
MHWSFDPLVVACLGLSIALYAGGLARLWRRAGWGHGAVPASVASFAGGWLALALALLSPLDELSEQLFSAHMVQHEVMMLIAAPLLVLGRPLAVWTWAFPLSTRRALGALFRHAAWRVPWRAATRPLGAWTIHALALWLWHVPRWFDAALESDGVHALQHTSFLVGALLFWWSILGVARRADRGAVLLSLFTTMAHTGALGALMMLSTQPWYAPYLQTAPTFGLDALQDQQLGGVVMWVPAGFVYIACGLVLASRWLRPPEPRKVTA